MFILPGGLAVWTELEPLERPCVCDAGVYAAIMTDWVPSSKLEYSFLQCEASKNRELILELFTEIGMEEIGDIMTIL